MVDLLVWLVPPIALFGAGIALNHIFSMFFNPQIVLVVVSVVCFIAFCVHVYTNIVWHIQRRELMKGD